jgi:hypothetical protein
MLPPLRPGEYFTHNFIMHMHKAVSGLEIVKPGANDLFALLSTSGVTEVTA